MALKKFVKISKISNLSDARYCAGMMADILGFNLKKGTEGYVSPETFEEITNWVAGVSFAGEFSDMNVEDIKISATEYALDFIETSKPDDLEELSTIGTPLILNVQVSPDNVDDFGSALEKIADLAEYIVITSEEKSLIHQIDSSVGDLAAKTKLIRAFGNTPESVSSLSDCWHGIQLSGTSEERPGFSDYGEVMDILETLEED